MKHTKLIPQVRCVHPGCNRAMYHLHSTEKQSIYGCTMGHIRKVARTAEQNSQPPNNAA